MAISLLNSWSEISVDEVKELNGELEADRGVEVVVELKVVSLVVVVVVMLLLATAAVVTVVVEEEEEEEGDEEDEVGGLVGAEVDRGFVTVEVEVEVEIICVSTAFFFSFFSSFSCRS